MSHPSQGQPLRSKGIDGEWIVGGSFFFFIPNDDEPSEGKLFTKVFEVDGNRAHGVNVNQAAAELEISGNDLLVLNREGNVTAKPSAPFLAGGPGTLTLTTTKGTVLIGLST